MRTDASTWTKDELVRRAETDYVRAYNGTDSHWYQAALKQTAGRITAAA